MTPPTALARPIRLAHSVSGQRLLEVSPLRCFSSLLIVGRDRETEIAVKMAPDEARRRSSIAQDAEMLANLGHKQELERNFSMVSMLGLAFAILNSWTALSASLSLALPSGGPTSVIWGLVTAGVCNLCLAASLAEFLSAYVVANAEYLPSG